MSHQPLAQRRALATLAGLAALASAALWTPAQADEAPPRWPQHAVRIIVPYGSGGAVDVSTRKLAQRLSEQTGQSFIVENKAGGTGTIGANQVAKAAADGYTLMANDTTFSLLPYIFARLPFDPQKDLQPVSAFLFAPMVLAVNSSSRFKTLQDLLAEARQHPGSLSYGTGGAGTTPHFGTEALGIQAGVKFMHVPFKGAAEATQAVLSNTVDFQLASTVGLISNVQGKTLRLLAISGQQRLPLLSSVPTFEEAGVHWGGVVNWTGLWAPAGTPAPVLQRLQTEIAQAMGTADVQGYAQRMGVEARSVDAAGFASLLAASSANWAKVAANTAFSKP